MSNEFHYLHERYNCCENTLHRVIPAHTGLLPRGNVGGRILVFRTEPISLRRHHKINPEVIHYMIGAKFAVIKRRKKSKGYHLTIDDVHMGRYETFEEAWNLVVAFGKF